MLYIIANKTAGHGTAAKVLSDTCKYLDEKGLPYKVLETERPRQAAALAEQALSEGADMVFALGGDGTVTEVAAGMRGAQVPMGIIPAGTGNDIIKALDMPPKPVDALEKALAATPRRIDTGVINDMMFMNVVGTGFDIETLQWTLKFKRTMKGILPYLLGVICSIARHRDVNVRLTVDGVTRRLPALMVVAANGRFFGGGMEIAPDALVDDALFDLIIIHPCPRWKIPFLLPAFLSGKVKRLKIAETLTCKEVTIEGEGQIMDVDGELVEMDVARIKLTAASLLILG